SFAQSLQGRDFRSGLQERVVVRSGEGRGLWGGVLSSVGLCSGGRCLSGCGQCESVGVLRLASLAQNDGLFVQGIIASRPSRSRRLFPPETYCEMVIGGQLSYRKKHDEAARWICLCCVRCW